MTSVNHWDEAACVEVDKTPKARDIYVNLFRKCWSLVDEGGRIILSDCAKKNLFSWPAANLGIVNPLAPTIEWYKHQQPKLWAQLLEQAGFVNIGWRWLFPAPLRFGAEKLLNNSLLAYLTTSYFILQATK